MVFNLKNALKFMLIIMAVIIGGILLAACSGSSQTNDAPAAYEVQEEKLDKPAETKAIAEKTTSPANEKNTEQKNAPKENIKEEDKAPSVPPKAKKEEQKPEAANTGGKTESKPQQTEQASKPLLAEAGQTNKPDSQKPEGDTPKTSGAEQEKPTTAEPASNTEEVKEPQNTQYNTDPVPEGKPQPIEPQDTAIGNVEYTCTLTVRCDTILENMDNLDKNKTSLVPQDGVIFPETSVIFYEGESVFNLLQREMKKAKIHMEFRNTPMYNSAYIMGINNLYEFDCGELSGWMYKVNGWFPNYGCSRYQLKEGDKVEWLYTCDLGRDLGEDWIGAGQ